MGHRKCDCKQAVYRMPQQARGFTYESWTGANAGGSSGTGIDGFEQSWSGPAVNGIPQHVNGAPTVSGVETDLRFAQQEQGRDDHRLCYWIWNNGDVPIELSDTDTRAESVRVYAGCDCPASLVHEKYQVSGSPHNSQGPFLTLPAGGLTKLTVLIHDPGNDFSGFWLRANEVGSEEIFDPISYQERPTVTCEVKCGCDLGEDETLKHIDLDCYDCGGATGEIPSPATSAPIADNEADAAIRTGQIGASAEYALSDHNHPIRRQANPGDPTLTHTGSGTLGQSIVLDRWSDEESYTYEWRVLVDTVAGVGWDFITVPNIAGFQRPEIVVTGSYRTTSNAPQDDDGALGASPRGPYMGIEASHWSSTQRVYLAHYRRDNGYRQYVGIKAKYTRA